MHARILRAALLVVIGLSIGAGYPTQHAHVTAASNACQSQHFTVTAPTGDFARQVCQAAEQYRRDLAIEWLGRELPDWRDRCNIRVTVGPHLGAGGATSFAFVNGQPIDWQMTIQGSRERVLDSVLPHEITHTIFATHFGRPLPRWADEGGATSVEHISERSKQHKLLIEFLTSDRGIPFNHMFAMKEYPQDILPLYSQGYSLARFLIAQRGKRAFVNYVGDGMRWNNWTAATKKHYGLESLSALQIAWLDWVKLGSPNSVSPMRLASQTLLADDEPGHAKSALPQAGHSTPLSGNVGDEQVVVTSAGSVGAAQQGWYSRQRDMAATRQGTSDEGQHRSSSNRDATGQGTRQMARPQPPQRPSQITLPAANCAGGYCPLSGNLWR
jgi:hypothetical protein